MITDFSPPGSFHNSRGGKVLLTDFRAIDFLEPFMHGLVGWLVKSRHCKIASFCLADPRGQSYDKTAPNFGANTVFQWFASQSVVSMLLLNATF